MSEGQENPAETNEESSEFEITISDSSGIHKFGSWEEVMRYREEQNENRD